MARSFNGSTDKIVVSSNLTVQNFNAPGSAAAWFYRTATSSGLQDIYALNQNNANFHELRFNNNNLEAGLDSGNVTGGSNPSINVWHHGGWSCAGTFGVAGTTIIYLDGVSDGSGSSTFSKPATPAVGIGVDVANGNIRFFPGNIADLAIWNVVLTATEFAALAKGARPYQIRPFSLVAWWPLDGLQSPEPDLSGNAANGTLTGTGLAFGPPFMQFTPRTPQFNTVVAAAGGGVKWEIFMRHSMLPMLLAANPQMTRRQAAILLGLAKEL